MKSLKGYLLVASPQLRDPNFAQTVVLMVQHDDNGALGLVLNRPAETRIDQAWPQVSQEPCERNDLLHIGGPCPGVLMVVHGGDEESELEIKPGLHFAAGAKKIEELVADPDADVKFFVGYAGWGAGQLEQELGGGSWMTTPATPDHVFRGGKDQWAAVRKEIGRNNLLSQIDPKIVPPDPSVN